MAQDLYSRLHELDEATLQTIATILELRGSHPQQVAIRAAYLDALGDLTGQHLLEVGCGTGVVARDLARRVGPGGRVVGTDPTPAFVAVSERLGAEQALDNLTFRVEDGRALPFADGAFDLTAAITVLCHVPERTDVLREIARVTRPGGTVLIVDGEYAANQVEHPDRALTTRIVDAWRASVVDDPHLMRRFIPSVAAAGLELQAVAGHVHVEAGQVDERTSFIWQWAQFAARQAVGAGAVGEDEAHDWIDGLRTLNRQGLLFGSVTYISVVARRP